MVHTAANIPAVTDTDTVTVTAAGTATSAPARTSTGASPSTSTRAPAKSEAARLRLFCFHHAGGSAWSFAGWGQRLGRGVEVVPVPLPPRPSARADDPGAVATMDALVGEVTRRLAPALDEPYAFYGHSMGSLVAYGVAQRQLAAGRRPPALFVAGAHRAPHLPSEAHLTGDLSDDAALELLLGLDGVGRLVREDPRRMRAVADRLRADLHVCGTYRHPTAGHRPLPCPVHVLYGTGDPLVSAAQAAAWRAHAGGRFSVHAFPGGHFFHREHKDLFFAELTRVLEVDAS
ncbi:Surfactin synthase thioesterase subunit [Streptomyces sp. yr375]|uniref:thioesterase II family protein n=1 Tax=Streptomyces sp. yr375 TaxID=1761906 RepID=UPI0008C75A99|nr:alpha/beta fold hydrolase [Streptomyces sp. yr375]SEP92991.1 Surfactin synthase thioesterase subunit [Streptomyces sp. yr375]